MSAAVKRRRSLRNGLTLIELLVAVFITLLITAIAIPVMTPSVEGRLGRETSRVITSHLQGARTRAIQSKRYFGVMIEPQAGLTDAGITLSYMAESEPWEGDFGPPTPSRAHVIGNLGTTLPGEPFTDVDMSSTGGPPLNGVYDPGEPYSDNNYNGRWDATGGLYALLDVFLQNDSFQGLIRPGDRIELGGQGRTFVITSGEPYNDANSNGVRDTSEAYVDLDGDGSYDAPNIQNGVITALPLTLQALTGFPIPSDGFTDVDGNGSYNNPPDTLNGSTFRVFRQPTRTAAHPLQLPNARCIDLAFSGTVGLQPMNNVGPITILFTPSGALHSIYYYQNNLARSINVSGPLFLNVGKIEKVGNTAAGTTNFEDLGNYWVTIHPQTGMIASTEVGGDANGDGAISLAESTFYAQRALSLGGR